MTDRAVDIDSSCFRRVPNEEDCLASDQKPAVSKSGRKIRGRGTMVRCSRVFPPSCSLLQFPLSLLVQLNKLNQAQELKSFGLKMQTNQPGASSSFWGSPPPIPPNHYYYFFLSFSQRYHTPTRSKSRSASVEQRGDSETPPHWKEEMKRTKVCPQPTVEKWSKGDKCVWRRSEIYIDVKPTEASVVLLQDDVV